MPDDPKPDELHQRWSSKWLRLRAKLRKPGAPYRMGERPPLRAAVTFGGAEVDALEARLRAADLADRELSALRSLIDEATAAAHSTSGEKGLRAAARVLGWRKQQGPRPALWWDLAVEFAERVLEGEEPGEAIHAIAVRTGRTEEAIVRGTARERLALRRDLEAFDARTLELRESDPDFTHPKAMRQPERDLLKLLETLPQLYSR